jgi:hypothetical protein
VIIRSLSNKLRRHDWFIVFVEVLLLAAGLLAAFQVDRWWEQRAEHEQERVYIQRLINDIEADIPTIKELIEIQSLRLEYADLLLQVAQDPESATERPGEFLAAIVGASYTGYPTVRSHTFEDLRSTGNMVVIRSHEVKAAIYEYYEYERTQSLFRSLYLSTEFRHWELAAGVLSLTQAQWLQNNRVFALPANVSLLRETKQDFEEIVATADRMIADQDLIDWLPQVREMQVFLIFSLERQAEEASDVLNVLRGYTDEIGVKPQL